MLERFATTDQLIVVALATFIVPAAFLAIVAFAAWRRSHGERIGSRLASLVALSGGLSLGTLLLFGSDLLVGAPIVVVAAAVFVGRWRVRRRTQAGLIAAGVGLPLLVVWSSVAPGSNLANDPAVVTYWAAAGALLVALGVLVLLRGDPRAPAPDPEAPAGQPGSRAIGSIAAAIREPNLIGPFGQPEIAMLVALVATVLVVPFVLPADSSLIVRVGATSIVAALIATEAYVRSWTTRGRRAFEAFSWLGEFELARFRRLFGGSPPVSVPNAERWLASHPPGPDPGEAAGGRVEVLLLAGRIDEARGLVAKMPLGTAAERFEHAALVDLVEWRAGAVDPAAAANLAAMERAAQAIEPVDGDERLLAEVTIATAKVRRQMADERPNVEEAVRPFLDVRERLGRRADGQLGRALRPRVLPALLVSSIVFGLLIELASGLGRGTP
jgi:hypothetical protein